jgi:hypothetical protein
VEGLEAMRLADGEGYDHALAAELMGVSRPTFSRILNEARRVTAKALSNGWAIHIAGGDFRVSPSETSLDEECRKNRMSGCDQKSKRGMTRKDDGVEEWKA